MYFNLIFLVEAWNLLIIEKEKFYKKACNNNAFSIINDEKEKLNEISKKIILENVYCIADCPFFLKRSNRLLIS